MNKAYLSKIPIRPINFADPAEKAMHDKLVQLMDDMLKAKQALAAARSERDTDYYTRRCQSLDQHIDKLVYGLYGLTGEEIALVEGRANSELILRRKPTPQESILSGGRPYAYV